MARVRHLNSHQTWAFKKGERRVRDEEIWEYVELSKSEDTADRLRAAKNLCPCHVRRRIDEVWDALFQMMEDTDVEVRRAAYHTLEDGGRLDDPRLEDIFKRVWETETDRQVLGFLKMFDAGRQARERVEMDAALVSAYAQLGKCDFCESTNTPVRTDYDTEIPDPRGQRPALACESCDR
ncbi:MAG: hypothetical protein CME19_04905 [Gemmatimonadetes bacterium]|nr:hypothetical protein [Gemmatimonadota bacterium]|tara:strand:+ start:570 stop:1109 length:540 start_codon:yes stop_codon:yes gene_type:complete